MRLRNNVPLGLAVACLAMPVMEARAQSASDTTDSSTKLPDIVVEATSPVDPETVTIDPDAPSIAPAADGGEFLRSLPGVSGSRMGGHGIDPVIRGLQGNQLNITTDGAFIYGGCPNRMDPPTSFAPVETFDKVTVSQGYQTVTRGPGGPGGYVAFEREAPVFENGKYYSAQIGGGWESNGNVRDAFADVAAGRDGAYLRAVGSAKEADNYEDGDGNEVRSSFSQRSFDMSGGYDKADGASLSLGAGYASVKDSLFEGAMMDAPVDESRNVRGEVTLPVMAGRLTEIRAKAYATDVDHVMDNYSLRSRTAAMAMRVDSDSTTYGGGLAGDLALGSSTLTLGFDYQNNEREAERYAGMSDSNVNTLNSLMWPDTEIGQFGLFAENRMDVTDKTRLILGARYDRVEASLGRADETVTSKGRSPNDLYSMYYGTTGADRSENNLGGLARLEYDLGARTVLHAALSRSVRTADATERSMASDNGSNSWVGNPDISPEAHHQAEIGIATGERAWNISATAYVDRVNDFIMRDSARGQDGVLLSNGATIYRNVEAMLSGFTVSGEYRLSESWTVAADAAYTYGDNLDENAPLAQIPPLEGSVTLSYRGDGWEAGTVFRGALKQTRVDDDSSTGSGRDAGETPSWFTQDLYASVETGTPFQIRAGVTNLFDRDYAYHLNRSNSFDATEVQVDEAGRSFYLRAVARF